MNTVVKGQNRPKCLAPRPGKACSENQRAQAFGVKLHGLLSVPRFFPGKLDAAKSSSARLLGSVTGRKWGTRLQKICFTGPRWRTRLQKVCFTGLQWGTRLQKVCFTAPGFTPLRFEIRITETFGGWPLRPRSFPRGFRSMAARGSRFICARLSCGHRALCESPSSSRLQYQKAWFVKNAIVLGRNRKEFSPGNS